MTAGSRGRAWSAIVAGAMFGVGLGLAGMTQPRKVIGFLDFFGRWDPSLMFVMGGALLVHFALGRLVRKGKAPLLDSKFHVPLARAIDAKLLAGAAIFGVGWGLGGFCPGPAIVAIGSGMPAALVFVGAMGVGMLIHYVIHERRSTSPRLDCDDA